MLNEITANPKIVKILHGCDSDIDWLQRDFSIYLRNVFDTHQAGKLLGLPRLSLPWLLSNYCGVDVDKQYQLADWRIRPLPMEMVFYARQDTRYLVYLYNRLKNELISKGNAESNLLHACLHQSNDICKKR
jgi:exosome complex exonuclease RRP6